MNQFIKRHARLGAIVAAALAVCSFLGYQRFAFMPSTPMASIPAVTAAPTSPPTERHTTTEPLKARAETQPSNLANALRDATDLRRFAVEAASKPALGGITYAAHATSLCRVADTLTSTHGYDESVSDLPYAAPEDPKAYAVRNAAYRRFRTACDGFFATDELGIEHSQRQLAQARAQGDPLRALKDQVASAVASKSIEARKAALKAIMLNGDPLLMGDTLERLLLAQTNGHLAYWINGEQVPVMQSDVFRSALTVLPCRLGLPCDERETDVLMSCIVQGQCYADRVELMRATLPESKRAEFASTLARLENSIREKRVTDFFP